MAKLSRIEGIDDKSALKLKNAGITTIEKLLETGSTANGRKEISKSAKISEKLIERWVNHADLFRIKGIAGHKAELLEAVGVSTIKDLAKKKPDKIYNEMILVNDKKNLVERVPGMVQVERWVDTAKKLPSVIKR